jgi:hypothetical protein
LHGAPTEANLRRDGIQGPPLRMRRPDLVIMGPPPGAPLAGQSCRRAGRRLGGNRDGGLRGGYRNTGGIMQRRGRGCALGIDARQLGSLGGEHLRQRGRQMLQPMEAIGHLAGRGSPKARRFRVRLGPIPHKHLDPGMGLQPLDDGSSLPIGEQDEGAPPGEIHQEGAIRVTLPPRKSIDAQDLGRNNRGAGGAADHPPQRVPTHQEAEVPAEPHPGRPTQGQAHGEETCRQPQSPPCPRRREAGPSLGEEATWPCDPVATPREIGQRVSNLHTC